MVLHLIPIETEAPFDQLHGEVQLLPTGTKRFPPRLEEWQGDNKEQTITSSPQQAQVLQSIRTSVRVGLFAALFVAVCGGFPHAASAADCGIVPTEAAAVGYTTCTYGPSVVMGHNWFKLDPNAAIATNANGSVTFHGQGGSFRGNHNNQQIGTAVPGTNGNFSGTAFGGGAYYEIVASFPTPLHLGGSPDWWLGEIEFWSGNPVTQWQGQPAGFNHWMEQDMPGFLTTNHALIGMRDRWGMARGGLTASGFSEVDGPAQGLTAPGWPLPPGFDLSLPHKYGYLWVPATATTKGYMKQFLDDAQLGPTVFWNKYAPNAPPPPVDGSSAYSVQDIRHYFGSFGSNPENPTTLYSFKVWQLSAANDLGPTNTRGSSSGPTPTSTPTPAPTPSPK